MESVGGGSILLNLLKILDAHSLANHCHVDMKYHLIDGLFGCPKKKKVVCVRKWLTICQIVCLCVCVCAWKAPYILVNYLVFTKRLIIFCFEAATGRGATLQISNFWLSRELHLLVIVWEKILEMFLQKRKRLLWLIVETTDGCFSNIPALLFSLRPPLPLEFKLDFEKSKMFAFVSPASI